MPEPVQILSDFNAQLVQTVRWVKSYVRQEQERQSKRKTTTNDRREAVLLSTLTAVEDPKGAPSSATFVFLAEQSDGTLANAKNADGSNHTATAHHRLNFEIPSGTYIQVERLAGRWRPYVANCAATESGSV